MATIQRNFVESLRDSGMSMARKWAAVKKFLNQKPEKERLIGLEVEYFSFCIDTDTVNKVRNFFHICKTTSFKGGVKYEIEEEHQLLIS